MNKIKIALAEDQQLFRNGIEALLKEEADLEVLTGAGNGKELLEWISSAKKLPDVVLADMDMPEMNGIELTKNLQKDYPSIKIIMLTVFNQDRFINKMIEAGAAGYLLKNCDFEEVVQAIRTVYKTGFYINENMLKAMRSRQKSKNDQLRSVDNIPIELSEREQEVLKLICMELTNTEIAERLYISARTVDGHRNKLLAKTGCRNTAGLVLFAVNYHIYESDPFV